MKNIKNIKINILYGMAALLVCMAGIASCSESVEDHYNVSDDVADRVSLWEIISEKPELSVFAAMLRKTSCDRMLSGEQSYTVWAPENEALAGIDTSNMAMVTEVVNNHLARFLFPASGLIGQSKDIYMTNAKKLMFERSGEVYSLAGIELSQKNIAARNGILHTVKERIPFTPNLWQFLDLPGYDSISAYMHFFDKREFIRNRSKLVDYNEEGLAVYDSVFQDINTLWDTYQGAKGIGSLNDEDSVYTMIVPDNTAWIEAYNNNYPYFRPSPLVDNVDSVQTTNAKYSLIQDLVFRQRITRPERYDSLVTTRDLVVYDPVHLFVGSQPVNLSNGLAYPVSKLNYAINESCIKPIKIEAEYALGRYHNEGRDRGKITNLYNWDNAVISSGGYLSLKGTATSDLPAISFELPNVLAAKYDIHCITLAPSVVVAGSTDSLVTRIYFQIQEWDRVTSKDDDKAWKTVASFGNSSASFVTKPYGISDIKGVEGYEFPYACFNEESNVFRLRLQLTPSRADLNTGKFSNRANIDYILLTPSL
ncbi:MAG: fasciclin domain-containing protein [Dysgonamonadaceae bacterium]|jgi:uncharacterized surface protein with fasciclin (FAS1) repeats|nr:fasciclin domain-containing protein [Dysgonamonadaceae bacterium]